VQRLLNQVPINNIISPFAFTTAGFTKTAAGARPTSGKEKKKAQKAKRATAKNANAAGQAAATDPQIDEETAKTAAVIVLHAHAKQAQAKKAQASTHHTHAAPARVITAPNANTNNKKKKKRPRKKLQLSPSEEDELNGIDDQHRKNVMKYLDSSTTHSAYSALVQKEWQRTAKEKKEFYEGLSPRAGLQQRVTRANKVLDKANASKARGTFFPDEVFEKYKKIKQACAYTIGMIYSANPGMDEEGLQKLRVAAIQSRNEKIAALLKPKDQEEQKAKTKQEEDESYLKQHYYSQQHAQFKAL